MLLKKNQLGFVTHFSFDFIPSALECYKLRIKCPVRFGRQWWAFISRHFFWIREVLTAWKRDEDTSLNSLHIGTALHLTWFSSFRECLWFGLQCFEKEMLSIFSQECNTVGFYIYDAFLVKSLFWKQQQQHVSNFFILPHLQLLVIVENPELLNLCTDIGTNCSAVEKSNMLLYPFLSF